MSFETLSATTSEFLSLHWNETVMGPSPQWSSPWKYKGPITDLDKVGCYALFAADALLYIGVSENPLAFRTAKYARVAQGGLSIPPQSRQYVAPAEWADLHLDSIATIGIPRTYWYLCTSLESFLLWKLQPPENIHGKQRGA